MWVGELTVRVGEFTMRVCELTMWAPCGHHVGTMWVGELIMWVGEFTMWVGELTMWVGELTVRVVELTMWRWTARSTALTEVSQV
eukprot:1196029-Prorocentrum_minimum.AAC.2